MPPFTREMARRHKKNMSAKQQRTWVHVARSAYDSCKKKGGTDSDCEASAIIQANGVTGTPAMKTNALATQERRLVIQAALTVPPHRTTLHNREHLVAPAVLIVEGVLNGAYIPGTSLQADTWDFVPIVINHPLNELGTPISARTPEVYDQYGIGHVYRAQISTGTRNGVAVRSLRAELWLDMDRIEALGGEALQALEMVENELPLECSTGFYSEAILGPGVFQDVPYQETLVHVRPDHLAVLPNSIGACSWGDGCGLPRIHDTAAPCACPDHACTCSTGEPLVHDDTAVSTPHGWRGFLQMLRAFVTQEDPEPPVPSDPDDAPPAEEEEEDEEETGEEKEPAAVLLAEQADLELHEALQGCLIREMGADAMPYWLVDVDAVAQSFTCRMGDQLYRRYFTQDGDGLITLTPDKDEVQRQTDYVTVPGTSGPAETEENDPMTMHGTPTAAVKARVNALINNERTTWTERERHYLEQQEEGFLILLEQQPLLPAPIQPAPDPTSTEEALAHIPKEFGVRETIVSAVRRYERHKNKLIDILVNTKTNPFSREQLNQWDDTTLEQLVIMAGEPLPDQTPPHVADAPSNYTGRRMPQIRIVQDEDEGIPAPPDTMTLVVQRRRELGLMS
jgi:hypothetical protein